MSCLPFSWHTLQRGYCSGTAAIRCNAIAGGKLKEGNKTEANKTTKKKRRTMQQVLKCYADIARIASRCRKAEKLARKAEKPIVTICSD